MADESEKKSEKRSGVPAGKVEKIELKVEDTLREFLLQRLLTTRIHSGPLPPPDILAEYEKACPGLAREIIDMAKEEGEHRRKLQHAAVHSAIQLKLRGQWFGFALGITGLIVSGICIYAGQQVGGTVIGSASLVSLVGVFVYGTKKKEQRRK